MRFYSAGNMYLSSIQQGIQAFHCLGEMVRTTIPETDDDYESGPVVVLSKWISEHKTLICLNGGNNFALHNLYTLLSSQDNTGYPVARFYEDDASMAGMLTCVGIILPEKIYGADLETGDHNLTAWEVEVATAIKRMHLAR